MAKKTKKKLQDKHKYVIGKAAGEKKTKVHKTVMTEKPTKMTTGGRLNKKKQKPSSATKKMVASVDKKGAKAIVKRTTPKPRYKKTLKKISRKVKK